MGPPKGVPTGGGEGRSEDLDAVDVGRPDGPGGTGETTGVADVDRLSELDRAIHLHVVGAARGRAPLGAVGLDHDAADLVAGHVGLAGPNDVPDGPLGLDLEHVTGPQIVDAEGAATVTRSHSGFCIHLNLQGSISLNRIQETSAEC